jgi:hypothetical protein
VWSAALKNFVTIPEEFLRKPNGMWRLAIFIKCVAFHSNMKECEMPGCRVRGEVEYNKMLLCHDCSEKEKMKMSDIYNSLDLVD